MKSNRLIYIFTMLLFTLSLAGCETKPQQIAQWKAEGNTGKLIKVLNDPRQFMRIDAINALSELKAVDAIEPLGALIKDPDVVVVHKALDALVAIGTPAVEPYMLQAITFETDPARLAAAKTLGELKSEKAVDPLINALNDKFENIAVAAAVSLGQIGNSRAIPALSKTSQKGSARLRGASTTSIRQIGGESSIQPLAAAMSDLSIKVRDEAVDGLIAAGAAAEPTALNSLRSKNDYARECAVYVLKGIKKVPNKGKDAVWFRLAELSIGEKPDILPDKAQELADIENGMDALIEAVAHPSYAIREHAFQALETIGEPAADPLVAAAASVRTEPAAWFNARSGWAGPRGRATWT